VFPHYCWEIFFRQDFKFVYVKILLSKSTERLIFFAVFKLEVEI